MKKTDVKRKNRFEKQREEMKNKLLIGAVSAFYEKGYHNTRVKDITEKAETAVGNFYHYFESKEQIFDILIDSLYQILLVRLRKVAEMNKIPRIESLKDLLAEYLKIFSEEKKSQIALIFIEQMGGISSKFLEKRRELLASFKREIHVIISRLLEIGFIREQNADLTSHIWQAVILESFTWWLNSGKKIPEDKLINDILNFLVRGTVTK
ncbi:MAG: TetR/AcrR family transcriptional regulator [Candidatus Helarchaeota archaeon]